MSATFAALTTLAGRSSAEAMARSLERLDPGPVGVGVFEMEDSSGLWEVGGYFDKAPDDVVLALLAAAYGARPFAISELAETDWVARVRRELAPVEAGRFFVHGSHDAGKAPTGREPLLVDASMAFGTGHHGTTQGCLLALDGMAHSWRVPARVADIGCGTAVLAMAAARLWPVEVIACDIDEVAVAVAESNVLANGLQTQVEVAHASGFDHPKLAGPFELIVANILLDPLVALASDLAAAIAVGGRAILSGVFDHQAGILEDAYVQRGFHAVERSSVEGWATLVLEAGSETGAMD